MSNFPSINMPNDVPLGTFAQDGLRAGPFYTRQTEVQADNNGVILSGNWDNWGPGVLFSSQNTYSMTPAIGTVGEIVADQPFASGFLPLNRLGSAAVTPFANPQNGTGNGLNQSIALQMDYPRVPTIRVVVGTARQTTAMLFTIFGTDWYGFPLQATFTLPANSDPATYVIPNGFGNADNTTNGLKAVYTINAVYANGAVSGGGATVSVSVQCSSMFGLPYFVKDFASITQWDWAASDMRNQNGTVTSAVAPGTTVNTRAAPGAVAGGNITGNTVLLTYAADAPQAADAAALQIVQGGGAAATGIHYQSFNVVGTDALTANWSIPGGGANLFLAGNTTVATNFTSDVRGLVQLPEAADTWAPIPNGTRFMSLTSYIYGADQFRNQLAAISQPFGRTAAGQNTVLPFLTPTDLYGVSQYYTGVHA